MKPCRELAVEHAARYVGVREDPDGSNRGPHIDRWNREASGVVGIAWCAAFVCGMYREACGKIVPEPRRASVGFLEAWAEKVGDVLPPGARPRRGDLICYRWDSDDWPDHIGFVERNVNVRFTKGRYVGWAITIEGNTGNAVRRRWRLVHRVKFLRIDAANLDPVE